VQVLITMARWWEPGLGRKPDRPGAITGLFQSEREVVYESLLQQLPETARLALLGRRGRGRCFAENASRSMTSSAVRSRSISRERRMHAGMTVRRPDWSSWIFTFLLFSSNVVDDWRWIHARHSPYEDHTSSPPIRPTHIQVFRLSGVEPPRLWPTLLA